MGFWITVSSICDNRGAEVTCARAEICWADLGKEHNSLLSFVGEVDGDNSSSGCVSSFNSLSFYYTGVAQIRDSHLCVHT